MKRWYAFSGIQSGVLSTAQTQRGTAWQVTKFNFAEALFNTLSDAEDYITVRGGTPGTWPWGIRVITTTETTPAQSKGVVVVPITPLPLFTRPGKVLTTRGFWDVQSTTTPRGVVSNFAFGMVFLPVSAVYQRTTPPKETFVDEYTLRADPSVPDPLLDDPGWFAYDSFVRVTTQVNQDPPFHSKSQRKFPANSVLCVVAGVEVVVANLASLRLDLGIRFRILIEH